MYKLSNLIDVGFLDKYKGLTLISEKQRKELNKFFKENKDLDGYITLYHGTSSSNRDSILSKGIRRTSAKNRKGYSTSGYVYCSIYPDRAAEYGTMNNQSDSTDIYSFNVKLSELLPDKDSLAFKRIADGDLEIKNTLADSLVYGFGNFSIKRDIKAEEIKLHETRSNRKMAELNFVKRDEDRQKFRDEVTRIFSDNTLTGTEQQRLDELQIELQIDDYFCKQAVKVAKENIYKQLLAKVYSDGVVTPAQRAELTELSKRLGMTPLQAASMENAYSTISNKNINGDTVKVEELAEIHHTHCINHLEGGLNWHGIDYRTTEWFEVGSGETYRYYEKDYIDNQYYLAVNKSFRDMESNYGDEHWVDDGLEKGELIIFDDEAALDEYICDQHQIKTIEQIENEYLQAVDKDSLIAVETALLKQRFVNPMFPFSDVVYDKLAECLDYNENIELSVLKTPINYEQNAMIVYHDISDNRNDDLIHTVSIGSMIDYLKGIKESGIERDIMVDNDIVPKLIKSLEIGPLHVIDPENEHDVADILPFLTAPFPKKNSVFNKVKTIEDAKILLKYATSFNDETSQLGFSNNENYPQLFWNTSVDEQGFCESSTWGVYKNAELHGEELLEDMGTPEEKLFFNKTFPENKLFEKLVSADPVIEDKLPLLSDELSDSEIEKLWEELENVPFDENDKGEMILSEDWNIFKEGTEREEIWHVFDESHSKGVAYLLNDYVPEWARNKGFGKNEPEKNILSMPGTDFIDDKEKMADFEKLTKEEFLASYSYLTSDDYDKTAEMKYAEKLLIEDVKIALADILPDTEESLEIKGVRIYFPENYGFEKDDKLHLLVEFNSKGKEYSFKEDQLFNILNNYKLEDDEKIIYDGLEVDFNPITEGKSGTIEQYLRKLEEIKNGKSRENLEKAREVADWIVQFGLERSTSMENCHVSFDDVPSDIASQKWIEENYDQINEALFEHDDNELLEYNPSENGEKEFNLYFCSNAEDINDDNTLFRKNADGRWIRKPDEDLEFEKSIDDSIHNENNLKLLRSDNTLIDAWDKNKDSVERINYLFKDGDKYIAVSNLTGDCWTEEFDSIHKALLYLYSGNDVEIINELSSERAEIICSDYLPADYLEKLDSKLIRMNEMSEAEYLISEKVDMMDSILTGINEEEVFNKDYATKETFINEFVKDEEAGIENKNDMAAQLLSTSVIRAGLNTYPDTWKTLLRKTDNIYPAVYAAAGDAYLGDSLRFFLENADYSQWDKLCKNEKYSKDVLENALGSIMRDHEFTVTPTLELADKLNRLPEALDFIHNITKENIKDYGDMEQFQEMLKSYEKYSNKITAHRTYKDTIPVSYVDFVEKHDSFPAKRFDIDVSKDNEFLRNAFNLKDDSLWATEETAVSVVIDISDCYKSSNVSEAKPQLAYLRIDSEKDGIHTLEEKDISIDTDSFIYDMFLKKIKSILIRDENSINYIDEIKKAGWDYVRYEDGSGHFRSPDGKKELSFDLATNEYKWNNGEWKIDEEWHPAIGAKEIYDEYVSIKYDHTYLFPEGFFQSKDDLKDYDVKYDGTYSSKETGVVQLVTGTHEELSRLAEYNGYELHPDFVYKSTDLSLDNLHEIQDLDRKPPFYKDRFYKRYEPLQDEITKTATLFSFSVLYPEEKQEIMEAIDNTFTDKEVLNYEDAVFISKTNDSITDAKNDKTAYLVVNRGNYNNQSIIYKLDYDKDNRIEKVTAQWENFVEQHPGHFNLSCLEAAAFATEHISTVNFDSPYHGLKYFLDNDLIRVRRADNNLDITEELKDYNDCYTINNEKYRKVVNDDIAFRLETLELKQRSYIVAGRIAANYADNGFELVKDKNGNLFTLDKKIGDTYCQINQPVSDSDLINNYRKFRFIDGDEVCVSLEALFKNPEYIPAEFDENDLSIKEMDSVYFMKDRYFIRFTRDGNSTYYDLIDNETGKLVCCDGEVINVTGITKYINNDSPEVIYSFANANGEETTYFELSLEQLEIATETEAVRGLKEPEITIPSVTQENINEAVEALQNVFEWYKNGAEEDFEFDFIKKVEENPEWIKLNTKESLEIADTLFNYASAHHSDHFDYEDITEVNGLYIDKSNLENVLSSRFNNLIQNELKPVTAEDILELMENNFVKDFDISNAKECIQCYEMEDLQLVKDNNKFYQLEQAESLRTNNIKDLTLLKPSNLIDWYRDSVENGYIEDHNGLKEYLPELVKYLDVMENTVAVSNDDKIYNAKFLADYFNQHKEEIFTNSSLSIRYNNCPDVSEKLVEAAIFALDVNDNILNFNPKTGEFYSLYTQNEDRYRYDQPQNFLDLIEEAGDLADQWTLDENTKIEMDYCDEFTKFYTQLNDMQQGIDSNQKNMIPIDITYNFNLPSNLFGNKVHINAYQTCLDIISDSIEKKLGATVTELIDNKPGAVTHDKVKEAYMIIRFNIPAEKGINYSNINFDEIEKSLPDDIKTRIDKEIKESIGMDGNFELNKVTASIPQDFYTNRNRLVQINKDSIERFSETPEEYALGLNLEVLQFVGSSVANEVAHFQEEKAEFMEILDSNPYLKEYVEAEWDKMRHPQRTWDEIYNDFDKGVINIAKAQAMDIFSDNNIDYTDTMLKEETMYQLLGIIIDDHNLDDTAHQKDVVGTPLNQEILEFLSYSQEQIATEYLTSKISASEIQSRFDEMYSKDKLSENIEHNIAKIIKENSKVEMSNEEVAKQCLKEMEKLMDANHNPYAALNSTLKLWELQDGNKDRSKQVFAFFKEQGYTSKDSMDNFFKEHFGMQNHSVKTTDMTQKKEIKRASPTHKREIEPGIGR